VRRLEIKRQMDADDVAAVSHLLDLAASADGHSPLGEHQWLDLALGGREGFAGLVAWSPGHDHPVAYAQVTRGPDSWAVELVIDPHHRGDTNDIGTEMLGAAIDVVRSGGGGHVHHWVFKPTDDYERVARGVGLRRGRDLWQMRRPLPAEPPPPIDVRPFRVGEDEEAWLAVNNRAFAGHPEQGRWSLATLLERESQPWFDAEGFLLHEVDGRLAGFCWTKVHADCEPPLGEIYVIAVDPAAGGKGLGRALTLAGLDFLHRRRGIGEGMLYVDAANDRAVRLYESLGFRVDHVDRAFVGDVTPAGQPTAPTPTAEPTA
jgi:mycothiol synthase